VEVGAVKLVVRRAVQALVFFGQRKLPDHLAGIMKPKDVGAGADREPADGVAEAEVIEHVHRVGAQLDARADLAQLRGLLVDLHVVARLHQTGGGRQSADAGPGDQNFFNHRSEPAP